MPNGRGARAVRVDRSKPDEGVRASSFFVDADEFVVLSYSEAPRRFDDVLTTAERAVARAATAGKSNAEIATLRRVSERTVANQMAAILRKLGLRSRRDLAVQVSEN